MKCLFLIFILVFVGNINGEQTRRPSPLEIVLQWQLLDYEFPTQSERQQAISAGNFVQENGTPIDVAANYKNGSISPRVFVTIPRFATGIPFTLATFESNGRVGNKGPMLKAYPEYSWHRSHGSDCEGITSAFRVAMNECNQMWVIDSGQIGSQVHCPPSLLLFDLNNDQLLYRYRFERNLYTPGASLFIVPILDVRDPSGGCQNTMIYVADVGNHGLVVYDHLNQRAWRVENKWMYPDPDYGTHSIAGESFTLMDGIFGMSKDNRNLYFHPLASVNEFAVPLQVLNDANNFANSSEAQSDQFVRLGSRKSECAAEAMDSQQNLYCVTLNPVRLLSWNVKSNDFSARKFNEIHIDERLIEFVSGMKIVKNLAGAEELWMISNRFQKISAGTQNPNEVNFRVLKYSLDLLNKNLHHKLVFN